MKKAAKLIRIAVFASGFGSNLEALMQFEKKYGLGGGKIVLVFSDKREAFALKRAINNNINTVCFSPKDYKSRTEYDNAILEMLKIEKIDLIVLAGYMLLLGKNIITVYRNRILNIHPALLPSFKGTHGIKDAYDYGVKITGVTVHFVDEDLDSGPIVMQEAVKIEQEDTMEKLESKIHLVEHRIYPLAVKSFCQGKLKIEGRKVIVL